LSASPPACTFILTHPGHLRDLPSFPTRRSSDLRLRPLPPANWRIRCADDPEEYTRQTVVETMSYVEDPLEEPDARGTRTEVQHRSEEHTSELQSPYDLVCRLLLEKKKNKQYN